MATGIIRILVGSAVAALALAAAALAVEGYNAAAPQSRDTTVRLQGSTASYNLAALKAMGARYEAMADCYLGQSRNATARQQHRRGQTGQLHRECLGPPYWAPTPVPC
jgi:hypothetical protein